MIQLRSDKNVYTECLSALFIPKKFFRHRPFFTHIRISKPFFVWCVPNTCVYYNADIDYVGYDGYIVDIGKISLWRKLCFICSKSNQLRNQMALLVLERNWLADTCFKLIFQKQPLRSQLWQTKISQRGVITHRLIIIRSSGHLSQISWGSKWGDKPQWACATTNQLPLYIL